MADTTEDALARLSLGIQDLGNGWATITEDGFFDDPEYVLGMVKNGSAVVIVGDEHAEQLALLLPPAQEQITSAEMGHPHAG